MITYFSPINIIITILWLASALADYLAYTHIWQLKEYRFDRFRDFLNTVEGKNFFKGYHFLWRSLISIVLFFWPFDQVIFIKYVLILLFGVDVLRVLYKVYKHQLRRPKFTKKAILIIILAIILESGLFLLKRDWAALVVLLVLRFFTVSVIIQFIRYPTQLFKKIIIKRASEKLRLFPNLMIIGITGSYGKTSVKTFLHHILKAKFKVIKTTKNINTEIGIAKFILQTDWNKIDIFIVEMGAYQEGEIKSICDMVKPKIGILTAIIEQHLSLFGDIKTTQRTKYELLRALPKDGLAVVNSDNLLCTEFFSEIDCKVNTFGAEESYKPTFLIKNVIGTEKGIRCTGFMDGTEGTVEVPIIGEHNFMNIAPCFLVGKFLGMKREEVREQCRTLSLAPGILGIKKYGKATIIDDTYNSNPAGFKAALTVMQKYPSVQKRIIITRGMMELGEKSADLHERIGEEISFVAEELVVITKDSEIPLRKGVGTKYQTEVKTITDPEKLLAYFKTFKENNYVILLENRMPENIRRELESNSI